jgi:predicted PurR-regulated permease PerM
METESRKEQTLGDKFAGIPFYIKTAFIFLCAYAFVYMVYAGEAILAPLAYATILAILLNPLVNFMINQRVPKVLAIALSVLLALLICIGFMVFISTQCSMFIETYPKLVEKFNTTSHQLIVWVSESTGVQPNKVNAWIKEAQNEVLSNTGAAISRALGTLSNMLIVTCLIPVYTFMILFNKPLLLEFIRKIFNTIYHVTVVEVLSSTKVIIQSYLMGLLIEAVLIAILNSAGLLLLGVDYAIIMGITGALLNVIPYIGGIIATALPMLIAYITKDSALSPVLVLLVYLVIQFIDNHYIIPSVVASKVKLNALISLIVVLLGGAIWGIPGMFLSIPFTAIVKVIFDHIEKLKPWGFLLGNIVPSYTKFSFQKAPKVSARQSA